MFEIIANSDLTEQNVPDLTATWDEICNVALTFDGYDHCGSFDACADIGNHWVGVYAERQGLPDSLNDLRTCLFFEQRRWHHFGESPGEQAMEYIYALLEAIRHRVALGALD